jgi:hypothetical protein
MLDPFDLSAAEGSVMHASDSDGGSLAGSFSIGNGGSASTGCAGRAAARAAADEPDDADHDYKKVPDHQPRVSGATSYVERLL